jgi:OPA family glycerol-3-phosphate transporter-like MFS transporter
MIPPFFKAQGNVSTVSGVLNASTYIGSAISTYGIAKLSDSIGWNNVVFLWFLIALGGAIICVVSIPAWRRKFSEKWGKLER